MEEANSPAKNGSSPISSSDLPHLGSLANPQTGLQHSEIPPALASAAITLPISSRSSVSKVAAMVYGEGNIV